MAAAAAEAPPIGGAKLEVLLPPKILASTPSARDGVDAAHERRVRAWACTLALHAARMLGKPHAVAATAQALLQRFYYRKSLKRFDAFEVAMGAVFLALKVEEEVDFGRTVRRVLYAFHRLYQRRKGLPLSPMPLGGPRHAQWKARLMAVERHMLKELGFTLYGVVDHAHKYVLSLSEHLGLPRNVAQRAYALVNDTLFTDLSLRYRGYVIAGACIDMAAHELRVELPPGWWKLLGCGARDMGAVMGAVLEYHALARDGELLGWIEPLTEDSIYKGESAFDRAEEARARARDDAQAEAGA